MLENARNGGVFSPKTLPVFSPKALPVFRQPSPVRPVSPFAMKTQELQAMPPPPPPSQLLFTIIRVLSPTHAFLTLWQAELQAVGLSGDINVQRAWDKQAQLARIVDDVRSGQYRPSSPSPPPIVRKQPPYADRSQPLPPQPDAHIGRIERHSAGPSAFARYLNSLLFPGFPQLLRQPFIFQDALVGAILMLVAVAGWITVIQASFDSSNALSNPDEPVAAFSYLQFWPVLVHLASLLHTMSMT